MAENNIVHNHTPKSETEKQGLFDRFRNKDESNDPESDGLPAKLHITDSSSGLSDEEEKKKDKTTKEQIEEKIEANVKMNVAIIQARDAALDLKQKTVEQIEGGKEKVGDIKLKIGEKIGGSNEKKEAKKIEEQNARYEEVVMQSPESICEPEDKVPSGYNKAQDGHTAPPPQLVAEANAETEHKEKKGILEMIKEKLPGYLSNSEEEIKKRKMSVIKNKRTTMICSFLLRVVISTPPLLSTHHHFMQ